MDPGETDLQCALRELEEETGIRAGDIEIIDGFLYENRYPVSARRYDQGSGTLEKTLRIFLARLHNDIDLSLTEHHGYQWFDWNPPHDLQVKTINPLLETLQEFLRDQQTS